MCLGQLSLIRFTRKEEEAWESGDQKLEFSVWFPVAIKHHSACQQSVLQSVATADILALWRAWPFRLLRVGLLGRELLCRKLRRSVSATRAVRFAGFADGVVNLACHIMTPRSLT